ncbi:MAG: ABC transporter permease [Alphaproteobacteria bacterium]|nr:ABC transporter permease [Alphaproteobacteria bacterium]MAS48538.1 ABC transporter permease [Alphaproteobacteria bacterium]MAX96204.1 ABC transporter permease [Alphaproteobacteria bacterium]MBN54760.1 ABC transporter permease [Alphaproteobacteria bacterium]OUT39191.1 MAG: ABC transporter permease [Micavibrio sp. TMED2]|tara:strand:- start:2822 stop:3970 length:1149 start_codon:yes stop_codon:yes gene_type:complete
MALSDRIFKSPIARRRWHNFKANRRGYWSAIIFTILFVVTLSAEVVANDKPLLIRHDGHFYMPVFKVYTETDFGGEFEIEADYRDPYIADLINENGWMIWPPIRFSYDTINYDIEGSVPSAPTAENWLGTDDQGRDVMARVIYGFRLSVVFGVALTIIGSIIGILVGACMGFFGGLTDLIGQRVVEIWRSLPSLYALIILTSFLAPSFWTLLLAMALFAWLSLIDVVRAEFLRARNFDHVKAARALGVTDGVIMIRHVLPNAMIATITFMPFILSGAITALTSLDFLGFGLPPGSPSLGELVAQGKNNLQAPWLGFSAFCSLASILILLTFVGEAVRDAFDQRKAAPPPAKQVGPEAKKLAEQQATKSNPAQTNQAGEIATQ